MKIEIYFRFLQIFCIIALRIIKRQKLFDEMIIESLVSDRRGGRCHHDHGHLAGFNWKKTREEYLGSGSGGGNIESGRNDLFTLRIIIENHFSVVFIISKETFWLWDERRETAEVLTKHCILRNLFCFRKPHWNINSRKWSAFLCT